MSVIEDAIPQEIAEALCARVRGDVRGKWWSAAYWQCWGCMTFTKEDPSKMCVTNQPGNRGCELVNELYELGITQKG